ncbi:MAG: glutamine synthetase family protein [Acidobacteria bacterium]|nr:glutamine synthetase family protein [Acidobacteriota bacterium]
MQIETQTKEEVLEYLEKNGVTFVNLWFADILGQLKSFNVYKTEMEGALDEGMGFDGSSIEGFVRIEESDLVAKPIPNTLRLLPYRPQHADRVATMFCEIYNPDGSRFEGDSFLVLERQLERMKKLGFDHFYVGPELEFFLLRDNQPGDPSEKLLDHGGYFGVADDAGVEVRRDIILACARVGIEVEYSHHEVAPSQHEIDLRYQEGLEMARNAMIYRKLAKEVAKQHNSYITFMPKPVYGENGSGMHVHQSLFKGKNNAFFDPEDQYHLSSDAKHYIAGLLRHAPEIVAITNQWVNSYQRLVPGFEAPTELSWARRNRSCAIRVPMYKPGKEQATRIEARFPDPACNFPLAFAAMLAAGLEGIEKKYELPEPAEENIYQMSAEERKKRGIGSLPGNLQDATVFLEGSELARKVLGDHVFYSLVVNQKAEWEEYYLEARGKDREHHLVTEYEIQRLLPVL